MLLFAEANNTLALAADIAALLEERDPLTREVGIDLKLRIEGLRRFRSLNNNGHRFGRIDQISKSTYAFLIRIKVLSP